MNFDVKLERAINEMARLEKWDDKSKQQYEIRLGPYNTSTLLMSVDADTPEEAIEKYVGSKPFKKHIRDYGYEHDPDQMAGLLRAVPSAKGGYRSFSTQDIKVIKLEKTKHQIEQWLNDNPHDFVWSIHFGRQDPEPTPGVITFHKVGNSGGDVLSPHMILHTAAHAVCPLDLVGEIAGEFYKILKKRRESTKRDEQDDYVVDMCKLLHFKSAIKTAREDESGNGGANDPHEAIYDMVAIYIKNGRVKIAPNEYCDFEVDQTILKNASERINAMIYHILKRAVGMVVTDD